MGHATHEECDELGMSAAQKLAAAARHRRRWAWRPTGCCSTATGTSSAGDRSPPGAVRKIVKGDATCLSIAAASIVAKVTRDRMMRAAPTTIRGGASTPTRATRAPATRRRSPAWGRRRSIAGAGCSWSTCRGRVRFDTYPSTSDPTIRRAPSSRDRTMTTDDTARRVELARLTDELAAMRLLPESWKSIAAELRHVAGGDLTAVDRLSQITFEARIEQRFHAGRASSTLPPTKQTSALPWVGLVCGALLLAVGGSLGGGPVLIGVALLGLFVFVIALAGSRVAHRHLDATRADAGEAAVEAIPMPADVAAAVEAAHRQ